MTNGAVDSFKAKLVAYRQITLDALLELLPRGEPQEYLYGPIRAHFAHLGKGIRPALCLSACETFGGKQRDALVSSVALEMLHNAFLVHDDIEDDSDMRHAQPTMHRTHGVPLAVNAGDAMNAMALQMLRRNKPIIGDSLSAAVVEEFEHLLIRSLEGQALELGWTRDGQANIGPRDYLGMVLKKTCWYSFIHPLRIGALIANRDKSDLDRFNLFGYYVGTAFQIQDDVLNLIGDEDLYGKEIAGDLYEGKRTLILAHLHQNCSQSARKRIQGYLAQSRSERSSEDVEWLLEAIHDKGSIEYAQSTAQKFSEAAQSQFEIAFANATEGAAKQFLQDLVSYMTERKL